MSEDVWSERGTTPDAIAVALRRLLRERHAANRALAPARVINLVVVVDRSQKHKIAQQFEHLGRHGSSRTIVCAVAAGRRGLDAIAAMDYLRPPNGALGLIHERVEIDIGPQHLPHLGTIIGPVLVSGLPTALWCLGHEQAIEALHDAIDVILLDSDSARDPIGALARAGELAQSAYVVDMAWIRTTSWRERLAASFDPPDRLAALESLTRLSIRHRTGFLASALLLAGWLASRMQWKTRPLAVGQGTGLHGMIGAQSGDREVEITIDRVAESGQAVAGVTASDGEGFSLSLDRVRGGVCGRECSSRAGQAVSLTPEATPAEGEILGEGVRQAMLRDPTYGPALDAAQQLAVTLAPKARL
jgi:glucose-6-phosphate dehydrogenase assembly protein OpcA